MGVNMRPFSVASSLDNHKYTEAKEIPSCLTTFKHFNALNTVNIAVSKVNYGKRRKAGRKGRRVKLLLLTERHRAGFCHHDDVIK